MFLMVTPRTCVDACPPTNYYVLENKCLGKRQRSDSLRLPPGLSHVLGPRQRRVPHLQRPAQTGARPANLRGRVPRRLHPGERHPLPALPRRLSHLLRGAEHAMLVLSRLILLEPGDSGLSRRLRGRLLHLRSQEAVPGVCVGVQNVLGPCLQRVSRVQPALALNPHSRDVRGQMRAWLLPDERVGVPRL